MTANRLFNWVLAFIVAILLGSVYRLDEPCAHNTEMATAASLDDAIKNEAAQARFTRAAAKICGSENAGWKLVDDTRSIQCTTKRGHKTRKVAL